MTKKWILFVMAFVLLMSTALADAGTALHISKDGFALTYDPAYFQIREQYGHDLIVPVSASESSMLIVPAKVAAEDADSMLQEAVGGYGPEAVISEPEHVTTENGMSIRTIQAEEEAVIYRFYLVDDGERVLCITTMIPSAEEELYGPLYDSIVGSIRFMTVRTLETEEGAVFEARYAGDGYAIWYPVGQIEMREVNMHEGFVPAGSGEEFEAYLMVVRSDVAPEYADSLLTEATAGYEGDYAVGGIQEKTLASGMNLQWVEAEQDGRIDRYYLVKTGESVYCLTASFPAEGEMDYGMIFDRMADSMEPVTAE